MRDPQRLDNFYDEVKRLHMQYFPDWRVGQLWTNFFGWLYGTKSIDPFFPEENSLLDDFKEFFGEKVDE